MGLCDVKTYWDDSPCWLKICFVILCITVVAALITGLYFALKPKTFENSFISKCQKFTKKLEDGNRYNCSKVWAAFKQAYVRRDECDVPVKAYDALIAAAPFKHDNSKTLLWSETEDVVNKFKKQQGLVTLADTLFGTVTKGYKTWCGKKGSNETFTTGCPDESGCENSPLRSYWNKVSAAFAEYAQGDVITLLNGSTETPFNPKSTFAKFEVPALKPGRVQRLYVVLVTQKISVSNCASLGELKRQLDKNKIKCWCKEVPESQMSDYSSIREESCGS